MTGSEIFSSLCLRTVTQASVYQELNRQESSVLTHLEHISVSAAPNTMN